MRSKWIQTIMLMVLLSGVSLTLNGQNFDRQKMDSLFSIIEENNRGMGSISIFYDGAEVYQRSYGYADVESAVKNNAFTKYRIGSITKTFTATIIMKLIEQNRLSLSTKLSDFYPQIKNADKITIAHLLQHRSGISNFTNAADYLQWNTQKQTKEQLMYKIVSGGISFEPDENFEYSNSNYVLLTFIAEDASNRGFSELLQEIIIKPCDLKNTFIGGKINGDNNEAFSYSKLQELKLEQETDMSIPLGAGFLISTPYDLNVFLNYLFAGKLVTVESLNQMKTMRNGFGFGLMQIPFYDIRAYGHGGTIDGFQANASCFPEQRVSVSLISNGVIYPLNDIIVGALSIYFGRDYKLPEFKEPIILTADELDEYIGVYSTTSLPIKIAISRDGNTLVAQGTGQPSFPLECVEKDKFKFDAARVEIEFILSENKMILRQNGMTFEMKRE